MKLAIRSFTVAAAFLIVACGGGQAASSAPRPPDHQAAAGSGGTASAAAPGTGSPALGKASYDTSLPPVPYPVPPPITGEGPKVIRTAQMTVGVASGAFDSSLSSVEAVIRGEEGYISGSTAQAGGGERLRTGTFTFQVPAAKFDEALDQLRHLGRVESFSVSGNDVSLQYVDLQSRLRNAEAQAAAISALLAKANSVQEILAVQTQLGQITAQVEQLKGQINYYDHATGYSTVSVTLREAGAAARPADSYGTRTALVEAAHNFLATINVVIVALGTIGPFLVLAGIGGLVWFWVSRSARRREAREARAVV